MLTRFPFFRKPLRAVNSAVCGIIVAYFKLGQSIIVVLLTSKNEENPIKNEGARVTKLYISFSYDEGQLTPKPVVDIQTYPSFYGCPHYMEHLKWGLQSVNKIFPIISLWEFF